METGKIDPLIFTWTWTEICISFFRDWKRECIIWEQSQPLAPFNLQLTNRCWKSQPRSTVPPQRKHPKTRRGIEKRWCVLCRTRTIAWCVDRESVFSPTFCLSLYFLIQTGCLIHHLLIDEMFYFSLEHQPTNLLTRLRRCFLRFDN